MHVGTESLRQVSFADMGNGFTLIKFTNEVDCNGIFDGQLWFVGVQGFSLPRWKKDFDPGKKEKKKTFLCFS